MNPRLWLTEWFSPLNLFEAHGHFCCEQMAKSFEKCFFASTYQAKSLAEANMVVLWGSFSKKLGGSLSEPIAQGQKKFVLHISGCEKRVENPHCFTGIQEILPVNRTFAACHPSEQELRDLLKEARACLRA